MSGGAAERSRRPPVGRLEALVEQLGRTEGRLPEFVTGLSRQNSVYRHVLDVCDRLADAALRGADAAELSALLAERLGRTVVLLDPQFRLRCCAGARAGGPSWDSDDPGARRLLRALATERRPLRVPAVPDSVLEHGCLAVPIAIGPTDLGYLLVPDDSVEAGSDDTDLLIASYVATLFALTLANERTSVELGVRHRAVIVESLVSGHFMDADDARRKVAALGMADVAVRVGVVRWGTDELSEHVLDRVEGLRAALPGAVAGVATRMRGTELVMILPDPARSSGDGGQDGVADDGVLAAAIERALDAAPGQVGGPRLTCGLSERTERAELLPQLLQQAEHAVDIGTRIGRSGEIVRYRELGIYRLLLQIGDMAQLWQFADDVLGPLIRYDATHKLGLVRTLSVFLNQRESLKQAARRLRVHTNTVSYRLARIAQLTPLNLADPEDRLMAHIAVKILEAQQVAGDGEPARLGRRGAPHANGQAPTDHRTGGVSDGRRSGEVKRG